MSPNDAVAEPCRSTGRSADDGDRAVGVGEDLERRRADDQLDEPRPAAGPDDHQVGLPGRLDQGERAGPGGDDGTIAAPLGAMPVPSVAASIARRIWASSSAVASSDSSPGSRTGPAATAGHEVGVRHLDVLDARQLQRPAQRGHRVGVGLVVPAGLVDPDRRPAAPGTRSSPRTTTTGCVGVVDDVVGGRAEQQRRLPGAAVADDDDDVGPELLGRLDQRLARAGRSSHDRRAAGRRARRASRRRSRATPPRSRSGSTVAATSSPVTTGRSLACSTTTFSCSVATASAHARASRAWSDAVQPDEVRGHRRDPGSRPRSVVQPVTSCSRRP